MNDPPYKIDTSNFILYCKIRDIWLFVEIYLNSTSPSITFKLKSVHNSNMSHPLGPHYSNQGPSLAQNRSRLNPLGKANKMGTYVINVRLGADILSAIDEDANSGADALMGGKGGTLNSVCSAVGPNSSLAHTPNTIQKLERLGLMNNNPSRGGGDRIAAFQGSPAKAMRSKQQQHNSAASVASDTGSSGGAGGGSRGSLRRARPPLEPEVGSYASLAVALRTLQVRIPSDATADAAIRLVLMAAGYYSDDPEADIMNSAAYGGGSGGGGGFHDSQERSFCFSSKSMISSHGPPFRRPPEDFVLQQAFADYTADFTTEPLSGRHGPIRPALKFPYYLILSLNTFVRQRDRLQYETEVNSRRLIEREYNINRAFEQGYADLLNELSRIHGALLESADKALAAKKYQERMRFFTLSRYMSQMEEDRHRMAVRAREQAAWDRLSKTSQYLVGHDQAASELFKQFSSEGIYMYEAFLRQRFHMNLLAELQHRLQETFAYREGTLFGSSLAQMRGIYTTSRLREQFNAAKSCKAVVSNSLDSAVTAIIEAAAKRPNNEPGGGGDSTTTNPYNETQPQLTDTMKLSNIIVQAQTFLDKEEIEFEMDEDEFVQLRVANGYERNPELYEGRPSCVNPLTIKGDVFTSSRSLIGEQQHDGGGKDWAERASQNWHNQHDKQH